MLAALAATGLEENTLVVFTADHGELLGERGLWYKMSFLEGSSRVPLIVRAPSLAARRVHAPVSQLDLAPTLADLAGAPADGAEFEGTSLAAALTGESDGPGEAVGEYLAEGVESPAVMIRRGRHKYIRCEGDPDLLYDLTEDPLELRNLAGEPTSAEPRCRLPGRERRTLGTWRGWSAGCSRASAHGGSSRARSRAARTPPGTSSRTSTRRSCTCAATPRVASARGDPGPPAGFRLLTTGDLDERRVRSHPGYGL